MFSLQKNIYNRKVFIKAEYVEKDLLISILGGDLPHIGCVSVGNKSQPIQTVQFPGHKEFYLTEVLAVRLREIFLGNFVIIGGVHYDDIAKEQIQILTEDLNKSCDKLLEWVKEGRERK